MEAAISLLLQALVVEQFPKSMFFARLLALVNVVRMPIYSDYAL